MEQQMEQQMVNQPQHEEMSLRIEIYAMLAHLMRQAPDENVLNWLADLNVDTSEHRTTEMAAAWPLVKLAAKKKPTSLLLKKNIKICSLALVVVKLCHLALGI